MLAEFKRPAPCRANIRLLLFQFADSCPDTRAAKYGVSCFRQEPKIMARVFLAQLSETFRFKSELLPGMLMEQWVRGSTGVS